MLHVDAIKRATYKILLKYALHPVQLLKSPPAGKSARQKAEFNGNMTQTDEDLKQTDNVLHQYLGVTLEVECAAANTALVLLFYLFIFVLSAAMWAFVDTCASVTLPRHRRAPLEPINRSLEY